MRQTLAIFLDAYRELNSKKLFWISLSISLAVVIALALPTQTERGLGLFGAALESGPFTLLGGRAISTTGFYKFIYSWVGINLWLGWGATILALISTASMIPDLVSSGSIELTLAKPLGRLRLFLTKFSAGLLFVGLQALVFAVGTIVVIGVRAGTWDARPLLIVPIMMTFFSFLHCISVCVGLLTRSTLMSLLAVLIIWLFIWALGGTESIFLQQGASVRENVSRITDQQRALKAAIATVDVQLSRLEAATTSQPHDGDAPAQEHSKPAPDASASPASGGDSAPESRPARRQDGRRMTNNLLATGQRMISAATDTNPDSLRARKAAMSAQLSNLDARLADENESLSSIDKWHGWLYAVFTCLPKTSETKDLFQRWVIDKSDWQGFLKMLDEFSGGTGAAGQEALNNRPLWWILGTSLGFEFVVLGFASVVFCRRDF